MFLVPEGRNERGRVATLTSFSRFDSYDMKSWRFRFGHGIFTGFKMARPPIWDARFSAVLWNEIEDKSWHFEASEDIMTKFKSQAFHVIRIKYWKADGSGNPSFLIPALWNIGILLPKKTTRTKHFDGQFICAKKLQQPSIMPLVLEYLCTKISLSNIFKLEPAQLGLPKVEAGNLQRISSLIVILGSPCID